MHLFATSGDKPLHILSVVSEKMSAEVTAVAFSPDGNYLAIGDANRTICAFKVGFFLCLKWVSWVRVCGSRKDVAVSVWSVR